MRLNDGARKIFLNTKGRLGEIDNSIRAFLQYVDGVMSTDRFVQEIDEEIQKVKRIEGEAVSYMTYEMKIKEARKEERREILVDSIRRLISKLKISAEQAMDLLEIPQAERQIYKSALCNQRGERIHSCVFAVHRRRRIRRIHIPLKYCFI